MTGFTVTVDPRGNDCGETLQQTVDNVGAPTIVGLTMMYVV